MTFISFEGIDGCGKTTQVELLRAHLESAGAVVAATREPGGTALAETIRAHLLAASETVDARAELLLFGAARAQHTTQTIRPALARGDIVVCDRFADSSLAYQGGGLGLDSDFIARMNEFATGGLQPDITFLLDLDAAEGLQRRAVQRGEGDRIEERGLEFQCRVREAYLQMAGAAPERFVTLDAGAPAKVVHNRIVRALESRALFQFSKAKA